MRGHDNNGRGLWSGRLTQKAIETSMITTPSTPEGLPNLPEPMKTIMRCEDCNGHGFVGEPRNMGNFQPPEHDECGSCGGSWFWNIEAYDATAMQAYALAAIAAQQEKNPVHLDSGVGGGVQVPKEPTVEMTRAAAPWLKHIHLMRATDRTNAIHDAYKAMINAAPTGEGA